MAKKILKKKKEQQERVPKFYIIRWMRNGKESYRSLVDDVNYITWMALTTHDESVEQSKRYLSWSTNYKDTYDFILKAHQDATTEDDIERNKMILEQVLKEPFYTKIGVITYEYEPMDEDMIDYITDVQREHQRIVEEKRIEELKRKQQERKANRLRNLVGSRFKDNRREQLV